MARNGFTRSELHKFVFIAARTARNCLSFSTADLISSIVKVFAPSQYRNITCVTIRKFRNATAKVVSSFEDLLRKAESVSIH